MKKKLALQIVFPAQLFLLCASAGFAAETPWWTQDYTAEKEITTTDITYNQDGLPQSVEAKKGGKLKFISIKEWTLKDFTKDEKVLYEEIKKIKASENVSEKDLLDRMRSLFGDTSLDTLEEVLAFEEYETATGYYAYLSQPPKTAAVALADRWFDLHASQYATPPETLEELQEIEAAILKQLAQEQNRAPEEIEEEIFKMEKYQEKYHLPKHVRLSEGLKLLQN